MFSNFFFRFQYFEDGWSCNIYFPPFYSGSAANDKEKMFVMSVLERAEQINPFAEYKFQSVLSCCNRQINFFFPSD